MNPSPEGDGNELINAFSQAIKKAIIPTGKSKSGLLERHHINENIIHGLWLQPTDFKQSTLLQPAILKRYNTKRPL